MKSKSVKSPYPWKSEIQTVYNIITKGHGGELKVESNEREVSLLLYYPLSESLI